ncbi:MAG: undecaprenyldiphospho-muramoylpentapeptide beta-N-acetylglucosaminyltransferase [Alphaproteobacteria bacterium]
MSAAPIVIAAGGTGGHVYPAMALANVLLGRGHRVVLASDARGAAIPGLDERIEPMLVRVEQLGRNPLALARSVIVLAAAFVVGSVRLRRLRPAVVVGFGGYSSVPIMLAAVAAGTPTLIHEQNAVLGRANRLLANRVNAVATSFAGTTRLTGAAAGRARVAGNPVRAGVVAVADAPYDTPSPDGRVGILVMGGSQGAHVFAEMVPAALARLSPAERERLEVVQQCRPEDLDATREAYEKLDMAAELASFFEDVPRRLVRADLVICRSGASTIAELCALGRPALLVPYPHAADDHQTSNARSVVRAGGAWLLPEDTLTPAVLATHLSRLLADPQALRAAAAASRRAGHPDAADRLADMVEGLMAARGDPVERNDTEAKDRPGADQLLREAMQ